MIKQIIKKVDRTVFRGRVKKVYTLAVQAKERRSLTGHFNEKPKKLRVNPKDFLFCQFKEGIFDAYDTVVRLLAIENYYHQNDYGFSLYLKMQLARTATSEGHEKRFVSLIRSVEENGFQPDSFIEADWHMTLLDGSHRLATALHYGLDSVPVKMLPVKQEKRDYSLDWFWRVGFTREEIERIEERCKLLLQVCTPSFTAFFWPALDENLMEDVYGDLNALSSQMGFRWESLGKADFDDYEFPMFISCVYFSDGIIPENLKRKKSILLNYSGRCVHIVRITFDNPCYRIKDTPRLPISKQVEKLKKILRTRYMGRVYEYQYDNICHITDNNYQTDCELAILNRPIDITSLFNRISGFSYVLTKVRQANQHRDFPCRYYYQSDIDFLVDRDVLEKIADTALTWAESLFDGNYQLRRITGDKQIRILVEVGGCLIIQFHFQSVMRGTQESFVRQCIAAAEQDGVLHILPERFELVIRLCDLTYNKYKQWHRDYVKKHLDALDMQLLEESLDQPMLKTVKTILKDIVEEKKES